jgi:hypothetical protein
LPRTAGHRAPILVRYVVPGVVTMALRAAHITKKSARTWARRKRSRPRFLGSVLELLRQRIGAAREQAQIGTDRHEQIAPANIASGLVLVQRQDTGGLADRG